MKVFHHFKTGEQEQLTRLIEYLDVVKTPHRNTAEQDLLHHDFKVFYEQYDARRGFNFRETFPRLVEWYDSIAVKDITDDEIIGVKSTSIKFKDNPKKYKDILAGEFLHQRLVDLGLLKK